MFNWLGEKLTLLFEWHFKQMELFQNDMTKVNQEIEELLKNQKLESE